MRPRPATWAALLVSVSTCLSPHKAARCALANLASRRTVVSPRTLRKANGSVLLLGGLFEEAATPGFFKSPKRVFELPPSNSPSRIAGSRLLCRNFQQSKHLTHALGTLCFTTEFPAIEKLALLVHKLCRTHILCGKRWKNRLQDAESRVAAQKKAQLSSCA
jgi:hypothetical protein